MKTEEIVAQKGELPENAAEWLASQRGRPLMKWETVAIHPDGQRLIKVHMGHKKTEEPFGFEAEA